MKEDENETVSEQLLDLDQMERQWFDDIENIKKEWNLSDGKYPMYKPAGEDSTYLPVIPVQCRVLIQKI